MYVIKDKKLRSEFIDEKNNLRLGKFDPEGLKRVENTKKYKNAVNEIIEKGLEIYNKYGSHVKKGQVGTKYRSEFFKLANSAEGILSKKANTIEYALGDAKLVGTVHKNVVYNKNGSVTLNVFVKFQISDSFENPAGFPKAPEWGKPYDMLGPERILPLTQGGFPKKFKSIKEYEEYEKSRKAVR